MVLGESRHDFRRCCRLSWSAASLRAGRDTTYGRCSMAGRPVPSAKSGRYSPTRVPWRALGLGSSAIGGTVAAYYSHPLVGLAIVICGTVIAMITLGTALFGSETTSDRAFRLLRWFSNHPEPDAPPVQVTRHPAVQGSKRGGGTQAQDSLPVVLLGGGEPVTSPSLVPTSQSTTRDACSGDPEIP